MFGTANPQANLDVAGWMAVNGRLALSSNEYLWLNQNQQFSAGVFTPGLLSARSMNVGGFGGWVSPGDNNLAVAGGLTVGGIVQAFQYRTDGQSWLRGQVYTGDFFGRWDSAATLALFGSRIWDPGDGWLALRSGGGKIYLAGEVTVQGALHKAGGGFRIDHPLDPERRYLSHSFVESPEMLNVYTGVAVTDDDGLAAVQLPDYFEALNRDHRFQLTALGRLALATVEGDVHDNAFTIRTEDPGVTVSWQVTGVRQDPWAEANRIADVLVKPEGERARFLHPALYAGPDDQPDALSFLSMPATPAELTVEDVSISSMPTAPDSPADPAPSPPAPKEASE